MNKIYDKNFVYAVFDDYGRIVDGVWGVEDWIVKEIIKRNGWTISPYSRVARDEETKCWSVSVENARKAFIKR